VYRDCTARITDHVAGAGADAITFDSDGRYALLTDRAAGTVTLVDVESLEDLGRQKIGPVVATGYSRQAEAFVAVDEDARLHVLGITGGQLGQPATVGTGSQASGLAVSPDGENALVVSASEDAVTVVDLGDLGVKEQVDTGPAPAEVVFMDHFALVRSDVEPVVTWVDLDEPSKSHEVTLGDSPAASLSVSADGTEVLAASPEDNWIYHPTR
jgi:DNA-binding beta-propeller fold protein YncE